MFFRIYNSGARLQDVSFFSRFKFIMKFTAIVISLVMSVAASELSHLELRKLGLQGRDCVDSSCRCNAFGGSGGLFCGNSAINPDCQDGDVFQCNSATGETCSFSVRISCQECGKVSCP
ncbi:hypothetical protein C8J56DRAFT_929157 [Mycena floridula]|nr:hypothetical protein C8J56DRAFT_929157 [Mycena floridula]